MTTTTPTPTATLSSGSTAPASGPTAGSTGAAPGAAAGTVTDALVRRSLDPAARRAEQRRRRTIGLVVAATAAGLVAVGVSRIPQLTEHATDLDWWREAGAGVLAGWREVLVNPWYWLVVGVLVVAERMWPARDGEGALTLGGAQDLVWTLLAPVLTLTVVALAAGALNATYDNVFGGVHLDLTPWIGPVGVGVVAFVVADFGMWFTHWFRHVVPTFWHFHAVHHAPTRMNPLMDNRVHLVEPIVSTALVLVPSRLLGLDGQAAVALAVATTFFTAFIHANLRTNLGPLRYLLISPQAHRVHHSFAPEHIDRNFGTVFSIWDRAFGTYYHGEEEYPEVGITDPRFPLEQRATPGALLAGVGRQTVYPFRQCLDDIGRYRRR